MLVKPLDIGEKITSTATYRNSTLYATSHGNIIVGIYGTYYKVGSLPAAKSLIDNLVAVRAN
jgi:hypothetical protein